MLTIVDVRVGSVTKEMAYQNDRIICSGERLSVQNGVITTLFWMRLCNQTFTGDLQDLPCNNSGVSSEIAITQGVLFVAKNR